MKINLYTIEKQRRDAYHTICTQYRKMISKYAVLEEHNIFNKKISAAQNRDAATAQASYSEAFSPYMKGYNVLLHPEGKLIDTPNFYKYFDINTNLNFFIGGAYGFEKAFVGKGDLVLSLSKLTMSHKIAKIVLYEQIYRGLTILHKHPYHK
ncbi:MAG TPA: 23S rRNA (pseudouridine(1915)-N(3))-methyltransferase RlmH [Campylobacteraceae bacterium]|nr:23S rRNA (pseudouridine(1915)-N(3))-methyltransferase RlmH [Campylobacteraceae bacterium]